MWKKDNKPANIESLLSQGVEIKGEINSTGSIRIDGIVDGKINIKGDLIVGERGKVKGEAVAENLILAGKIEGNVKVSGRLEITSSGAMIGDATCAVISIEEGGFIEGSSKMLRNMDKIEPKKAGNTKEASS